MDEIPSSGKMSNSSITNSFDEIRKNFSITRSTATGLTTADNTRKVTGLRCFAVKSWSSRLPAQSREIPSDEHNQILLSTLVRCDTLRHDSVESLPSVVNLLRPNPTFKFSFGFCAFFAVCPRPAT